MGKLQERLLGLTGIEELRNILRRESVFVRSTYTVEVVYRIARRLELFVRQRLDALVVTTDPSEPCEEHTVGIIILRKEASGAGRNGLD